MIFPPIWQALPPGMQEGLHKIEAGSAALIGLGARAAVTSVGTGISSVAQGATAAVPMAAGALTKGPLMKYLAPAALGGLAMQEIQGHIGPPHGAGIRELDDPREQAQAEAYRGGFTRQIESSLYNFGLRGTENTSYLGVVNALRDRLF